MTQKCDRFFKLFAWFAAPLVANASIISKFFKPLSDKLYKKKKIKKFPRELSRGGRTWLKSPAAKIKYIFLANVNTQKLTWLHHYRAYNHPGINITYNVSRTTAARDIITVPFKSIYKYTLNACHAISRKGVLYVFGCIIYTYECGEDLPITCAYPFSSFLKNSNWQLKLFCFFLSK